jgi:hypothetical protein
MLTVSKSRGGSTGLMRNFGMEGIRGCWRLGTTFGGFIAFLITSFAKNLERGSCFIPNSFSPL